MKRSLIHCLFILAACTVLHTAGRAYELRTLSIEETPYDLDVFPKAGMWDADGAELTRPLWIIIKNTNEIQLKGALEFDHQKFFKITQQGPDMHIKAYVGQSTPNISFIADGIQEHSVDLPRTQAPLKIILEKGGENPDRFNGSAAIKGLEIANTNMTAHLQKEPKAVLILNTDLRCQSIEKYIIFPEKLERLKKDDCRYWIIPAQTPMKEVFRPQTPLLENAFPPERYQQTYMGMELYTPVTDLEGVFAPRKVYQAHIIWGKKLKQFRKHNRTQETAQIRKALKETL